MQFSNPDFFALATWTNEVLLRKLHFYCLQSGSFDVNCNFQQDPFARHARLSIVYSKLSVFTSFKGFSSFNRPLRHPLLNLGFSLWSIVLFHPEFQGTIKLSHLHLKRELSFRFHIPILIFKLTSYLYVFQVVQAYHFYLNFSHLLYWFNLI